MSKTYVYIHNADRSREYAVRHYCISAGTKLIQGPHLEYRVLIDGEYVTPQIELERAQDRANSILKNKRVGTTVGIHAFRGHDRVDGVRFRAMEDKPPVAHTEGVEGIDRFVGWVEAERKAGRLTDRRYAGICVCKPDSDHRDCAAVDIFASDAHMTYMLKETFNNQDWYHTKYSILAQTIYFPTGGTSYRTEHYYGEFHSHLHLSVNGGIPNSAC